MTGVAPSGSGSRASHEAAKASSPEASIPNAAFTPGPWYASEPFAGFSSIKQAETDALIFGIAAGDPDEKQSDKACEANARLIAAAPDGFEAGEEAITALNAMMDAWFDYHDAHSLTQPVTGIAGNAFDKALAAREKLEAFIAKARGEAS